MKHKLKGKKKLMIQNLISTLGNVTKSAEKSGIERCTHYDWLTRDPAYKEAFDNIEDFQVDFYESALNQLVKDKTPSAIIFALKCKGKSRGWVERQEVEQVGDNSVRVEFVEPKKKKEDEGE